MTEYCALMQELLEEAGKGRPKRQPFRKSLRPMDRTILRIVWEKKCAYCGDDLRDRLSQTDHILPVARGGLNVLENLAVSCQVCNAEKGDRTADEFGHPDVSAKAMKIAAMVDGYWRGFQPEALDWIRESGILPYLGRSKMFGPNREKP